MSLWDTISQHISTTTGESFMIKERQSVGGGCINEVNRLSNGKHRYLVKTNHISHGDMFEAEAAALLELADTETVKVPRPLCHGDDGKSCYLVMEYLDMVGSPDMESFGQQFAALHQVTHGEFGWHRNNTIGATPQVNNRHADWIEFWRTNRLGYQLDLAARNGYGGELQSLGDQLMSKFPSLFDSYQPLPSLLHGDLWSGNASALKDGRAVIYDPALYYGDREADLAMTQLFGSFGQRFYDAYNDVWPIDPGYRTRKTFYNLYHIINHLNMFGTGYLGQSLSMAERVLAEL